MHVHGTLMAEIYQKSMRLSNSARAGTSSGQIINHMAVDAEQLQQVCGEGGGTEFCLTAQRLWGGGLKPPPPLGPILHHGKQ